MAFGWLSGFAFGGGLHCFVVGRWVDGSALYAVSILLVVMAKLKKKEPNRV